MESIKIDIFKGWLCQNCYYKPKISKKKRSWLRDSNCWCPFPHSLINQLFWERSRAKRDEPSQRELRSSSPFMVVVHKGRHGADLDRVRVVGWVFKQAVVRVEQLSGHQEEKLSGGSTVVQPADNTLTSAYCSAATSTSIKTKPIRVIDQYISNVYWVICSNTWDHWSCWHPRALDLNTSLKGHVSFF